MSEREQAEQVATEEPEPVEEPAADVAADGDEPPGDGEGLDALSAAMDGEQPPEPRRHWLRWPGFVGALLVVAVVILVPCGGAVLYLTGAFADPGRFTAAPDACAKLAAGTVGDKLEVAMAVTGRDHTGTGSTCDYGLDRARNTAASAFTSFRQLASRCSRSDLSLAASLKRAARSSRNWSRAVRAFLRSVSSVANC